MLMKMPGDSGSSYLALVHPNVETMSTGCLSKCAHCPLG
jgi:hypothetical protein